MNHQLFFDTAVAGIIAQGRPSVDNGGACVYRTIDGLKCALGHVMAEADYRPSFENKIPGEQSTEHLNRALGLETGEDIIFAQDLQSVHDDFALNPSDKFVANFTSAARSFAMSHELEWNFS